MTAETPAAEEAMRDFAEWAVAFDRMVSTEWASAAINAYAEWRLAQPRVGCSEMSTAEALWDFATFLASQRRCFSI